MSNDVKLISICGTSSTGKSSVISCLHEKLGEKWIIFSTDSYLKMLGSEYTKFFDNMSINDDIKSDSSYFEKNDFYYLEEENGNISCKYGKKAIDLFNTIPDAVSLLLNAGFYVILEAFVETKGHIEFMKSKFADFKSVFIYFKASKEDLQKREIKRQNRLIGTANSWLSDFTCEEKSDIIIDTSQILPNEVAHILQRQLKENFSISFKE